MIKLRTNVNYELTVYYGDHNMSDIMVTSEYDDKMTLEQLYFTNESAYAGPDSNNSDSFILESLLFSLLEDQVTHLGELLNEITGENINHLGIPYGTQRVVGLANTKRKLIRKLDKEEKKKKLFGDAIEDPSFKNKTKWLFFDYLLNFYEARQHTIQDYHFDIQYNEHFINNVKEFYSDMVGIYSSEHLLKSYDIQDADDMYLVLVSTKNRILEKSKIDKANLKQNTSKTSQDSFCGVLFTFMYILSHFQ